MQLKKKPTKVATKKKGKIARRVRKDNNKWRLGFIIYLENITCFLLFFLLLQKWVFF